MAKKKSGYKHDDDNIPYMTDNMKKALDQGKDLPIEQLVSDKALAAVEADRSRRAKPIRADQMQPITKAEAAMRTRLTRDGPLPLMPATRAVIPKPYERPRISVSASGGHQKTWQSVRAGQVAEDDIIPDLGRVIEVREVTRHEEIAGVRNVATGVSVVLVGAGGNVAVFDDPLERIQVFRKEPDGEVHTSAPGEGPASGDRGEAHPG